LDRAIVRHSGCRFTKHKTLARRESGHHVDRRLSSSLVGGTACCLAIDGDHIRRHADQLGNPGGEATLEFRSVERRENVAKLIVRRRPVPKRQEPEGGILLAKAAAPRLVRPSARLN
jgi:hypothetical protein